MDRGGDVFGALTWGLRRYAWVVALAVIGIGMLVPLGLSRSTPVYEAEAILAPNKELTIPNLDALPRYGEVVFISGAVADSVRESFGLSGTSPVIPERVELVTEQDNVAFTVIGRSEDPTVAAQLANTAAAAFQLELNQTSDAVGYFIVLSQAEPPASAEPSLAGGNLALAIGVLGGLVVGLALVALLVVIRRPVLDPEAAKGATGAPVLARVTIPRGRGDVRERDAHGVGVLCRRLLAGSSSVVLLAGPKNSAGLRHRLTPVLTTLLGRSRSVVVSRGGEQDLTTQWELDARRGRRARSVPGMPKAELVLVDGPTADERMHRPDSALMVLVVPEGIGLNALRQAAEEYFDGGPAAVVLVRKRGLGGRGREPVTQVAPSRGELNGRGPAHAGEQPGPADEDETRDRTAPGGRRGDSSALSAK